MLSSSFVTLAGYCSARPADGIHPLGPVLQDLFQIQNPTQSGASLQQSSSLTQLAPLGEHAPPNSLLICSSLKVEAR